MSPKTDEFLANLNNQWLDHKRQRADPPADALIRDLVAQAGPKRAKQLFDTLIRNIELPLDQLPLTIRSFVQEHEQLPPWTEPKQLQLAHELFVDHGPKMLVFLYFKSLPILYACRNGAQVLVQTGRLAHQSDAHLQFSRRIAETGQFLINVMLSPNLARDKKAIHTILKVRLIHASIRHFIPANRWNEASLGKPINQEDLAITLMTFSLSLLQALEQFHIVETEERKTAFFHTWKVVGTVLGIEEDLLPPDLQTAKKLYDTILGRQVAPSAEGVRLTQALLQFSRDNIPFTSLKNVAPLLIRHLIGPEMANQLGVKGRLGCMSILLPEIIRSYFGWTEKLEDRPGSLPLLINAISRELTQGMVQYFNEYKGVPFQIPQHFKQRWGIDQ